MNLNGIILLVVIIVVISAVVGAITQFLNRLGEMNNNQNVRRPPAAAPRADAAARARGGAATQDMDRFLAEIDRLRRKNAGERTEEERPKPVATPVARPTSRSADRPRPRVTELAETPRGTTDAQGFSSPPAAPPSPIWTPTSPGGAYGTSAPEALPVATVVAAPASMTGAPATRVTRLPQRVKPVPKNDLARNLNGLLGSGQGAALAVILHEVLAPPKSRKG